MIVDNEYEDVGRKVLDGHNLNEELEEKLHERKGKSGAATEKRPGDAVVRPLPPVATLDELAPMQSEETDDDERSAETSASSTGNTVGAVVETTTAVESLVAEVELTALAGEPTEWKPDDNSLEELLGICYKSFACGSVGLFVPTPFGDYIAFHEGCPHYYLSMESIAASKRDGRYAVTCISASAVRSPVC